MAGDRCGQAGVVAESGHLDGAAGFGAEAARFKVRSLINFPVIVKGLFRGVLCIHQSDRVRYWSDDEAALVEAVVVDMAYRRRGIATALIRRMLADTAAAGCNKIQLLSHKRHAHDGAHRLYIALGFEAEAEGFRLYQRQVPVAVAAAR